MICLVRAEKNCDLLRENRGGGGGGEAKVVQFVGGEVSGKYWVCKVIVLHEVKGS